MTSCPVCGVQFKPSHTGRPQRFCSATCRYKGGQRLQARSVRAKGLCMLAQSPTITVALLPVP